MLKDANKPKLTVITVSYNQEKFIAQALDGFVMQKTDFPFIVIVGDDGSTDKTQEIIKEYAEKYPDIIKPILQKNNTGIYKNAMTTYNKAESEYVALCEGDDYWTDPLKLQKQVDFLDANPKYSICFHNVKTVFEDKSQPDNIFPPAELRFNKTSLELDDLLKHNFIQTNSVVYRWRFHKDEPISNIFPVDILPGDWFIHILHALKGKIGFIDETMSVYRRHPDGLWWESAKNINNLHLIHGMKELKFYIHVQKLVGSKNQTFKKTYNSFVEKLIKIYLKNMQIKKALQVMFIYGKSLIEN